MIHHLHTHLHLLKNVQQKRYRGREGTAAEKNWTTEEIETLIMLWEGSEILYKVSLSDYLNKDKKTAAINQMSKQLETDE